MACIAFRISFPNLRSRFGREHKLSTTMDPFFIIIMLAIAALVAFFKMGASNGSAAKRTLSAGPKKTSNTFFRIPDQFTTLEQITEGLRTAGLEACQLIMAVDFTVIKFSKVACPVPYSSPSSLEIKCEPRSPYV